MDPAGWLYAGILQSFNITVHKFNFKIQDETVYFRRVLCIHTEYNTQSNTCIHTGYIEGDQHQNLCREGLTRTVLLKFKNNLI